MQRPVESETLQLLTIKGVAALLAVSVSTVRRLEGTDRSFPRAVKIRGTKRWRESDIKNYLDTC